MSVPEVRERHITREHDYGRDCWCNPIVITEGVRTLMPYTTLVVRWEPIGANQLALHIDRRED